MTQLSPQEIEERLRATPAPPPPEGLAERIRSDIPHLAPVATPRRRVHRQRWLIAASLAVAALGTVLVYRAGREVELVDGLTSDEETTTARPMGGGRPGDLAVTPPEGADVRQLPEAPRLDVAAGPEASAEAPAEVRERRIDPGASPDRVTAAGDDSGRAAPASPAERSRRELDAPRPRAKKVPVPDPAPSAAEPEELLTVTSEAPLLDEMRIQPGAMVGGAESRRALPTAQALEAPHPTAPPSTGGTAEPNDQPYGDVFFRSYGVNPFIDTEDDRLSTFGLDVDTGSYTVLRRYLEDGHLPPHEAVRVEEMINYFDYGDPAPRRGDFAIAAQAGPAPFADGPRYRLLRFNIRAREVTAEDRKPATLIFVVDVSGSMNRENRLGLVKRSLFLLLDQLRSDDRVGLVVYGSSGRVLLEPTADLEAIRGAIDRLRAGGSTNAEEGLVLGYDLARRHFREGAIHRLILCSDGVANVGRTGPDSILARIEREGRGGIELTTVGFGMGNYNDVLMEQLADKGNGSYSYVDELAEAERIFVENLTGTLQTVASDAKVQVEFNPETVSRYRLLGYENRDIADERFRDDSVDAGEIGAGHTVTALYEIKLAEGARARAPLATLRLRYRSQDTGEVIETAHEVRVREIAGAWTRAPRELRLTAVVAELGEILRGSYWAREGDLDDLFARAQQLAVEYEGDLAVAELATLVGKAARLSAPDSTR